MADSVALPIPPNLTSPSGPTKIELTLRPSSSSSEGSWVKTAAKLGLLTASGATFFYIGYVVGFKEAAQVAGEVCTTLFPEKEGLCGQLTEKVVEKQPPMPGADLVKEVYDHGGEYAQTIAKWGAIGFGGAVGVTLTSAVVISSLALVSCCGGRRS